jgi:hypothetical protein
LEVDPLAPFSGGFPPNPLDAFGVDGPDVLGGIADAGIPGVSQAAGALEVIATFFQSLSELLLTPGGWVRVGKLLLGLIALLWGFNILVRDTTGTDVGRGAKKAAEAAAVVATVK